MIGMLLAVGVASGVPLVVAALALGAVDAPIPTAVVVLAGLVRRRIGPDEPVSVRLTEVAAACRSGATLRQALARVLPGDAAARLEAGRPWDEASPEIETAFGRYGDAVRTALGLLSRHGGPPAGVFAELASQAVTDEVLASERSAGAAPGLLQAAVVGGIPAAVLLHAVVTGRLARLAALGAAGTALAWIGAGATIAGVAVVAVMVRRASR